MSAYYYTSMRNVFVGALVAVGFFLFLYKGFSKREDLALTLAGAFAVGVAMFPTKAKGASWDMVSVLHTSLAVAFFLCIAYVCIWRASDTLSLIRDIEKARKYQATYSVIGIAMIISPLAAILLAYLLEEARVVIFAVEAAGVVVFAIYWFIKSKEMKETDAESLALEGLLEPATAPTATPGSMRLIEPWGAREEMADALSLARSKGSTSVSEDTATS
jgi:hypothetical protein